MFLKGSVLVLKILKFKYQDAPCNQGLLTESMNAMNPLLHMVYSSKQHHQCTNNMQIHLNYLGALQQLLHQQLFCQLFRGCEN